jgi:hypothetical protein
VATVSGPAAGPGGTQTRARGRLHHRPRNRHLGLDSGLAVQRRVRDQGVSDGQASAAAARDQLGDAAWLRRWNNLAQNPTSTAYGIPQFLNSTWATVGGHKTSDPALQIQYGLKYMNKYGGPNGAAAFWKAHHWYENGTNYVPSDQLAVLHKGEAVVPASQNQGAPYQGGGEATFHIYDTDGVLMGTMRGHAEEVVVGALSGVANRRRYNS